MSARRVFLLISCQHPIPASVDQLVVFRLAELAGGAVGGQLRYKGADGLHDAGRGRGDGLEFGAETGEEWRVIIVGLLYHEVKHLVGLGRVNFALCSVGKQLLAQQVDALGLGCCLVLRAHGVKVMVDKGVALVQGTGIACGALMACSGLVLVHLLKAFGVHPRQSYAHAANLHYQTAVA